MPESLEAVKDRLRQSFLGKAGIHGIGLNRAEQAIRVYISSDAESDQADMLEQVRQAAGPFRVIVVKEERPHITS
jgi:hypothetical protein